MKLPLGKLVLLSQCEKTKIYSHLKNIPWNQLVLWFVSVKIDFTEFCSKILRGIWKRIINCDHYFYGKIYISFVKSTSLLIKSLNGWFHGKFLSMIVIHSVEKSSKARSPFLRGNYNFFRQINCFTKELRRYWWVSFTEMFERDRVLYTFQHCATLSLCGIARILSHTFFEIISWKQLFY